MVELTNPFEHNQEITIFALPSGVFLINYTAVTLLVDTFCTETKDNIYLLVMKTHHVVSFSREMDCIREGFSRVKVILSKRQTSPVDPHSVSGRFTSLSPYLPLSPKFQGFNASLYR